MNVINLSLGEPEVEPSRDLVVHGDRRRSGGRRRARGRGRQRLRRLRLRIDRLAGQRTRRDHRRSRRRSRNTIADFSSAGPTPVSLQLKPDVARAGCRDHLVAAGEPGRPVGHAQRHEHGGAAGRRRRGAAQGAAPDVDGRADQVGARADGRPGAPRREVSVTREGGGVVDLRAPTSRCCSPRRPGFRSARSERASRRRGRSTLTDAGGGAGDWSAVVVGSGPVTVPPTVTVPGQLTVTATGAQATGEASGFVVLTHGTDVRRIPYWFAVDGAQARA